MIGESWRIREAVEAFAKRVGVAATEALDGSYNFVLSRSGALSFSISECGSRLSASLSWREFGPESDILWLHLRKAGFDQSVCKFLHAAASEDGDLFIAFEFDEDELDGSLLETAVRRLIDVRNA